MVKINDLRYVRLLTAGVPGQGGGGGEADHQVEDGPGHDHAVVHVQEAHLGPGVSVDTLLLCVPLTRTMVAGPVPPSSGHSRPTSVMPPSPRYWPTATSEHSKHKYSFGDIVAFIHSDFIGVQELEEVVFSPRTKMGIPHRAMEMK